MPACVVVLAILQFLKLQSPRPIDPNMSSTITKSFQNFFSRSLDLHSGSQGLSTGLPSDEKKTQQREETEKKPAGTVAVGDAERNQLVLSMGGGVPERQGFALLCDTQGPKLKDLSVAVRIEYLFRICKNCLVYDPLER